MKEILLSPVGKRVDNRHNWSQGGEKRAAVVCPTGDQHQQEKEEEHRRRLSETLEGMPLKRKRVRSSYVVVVKRKQTILLITHNCRSCTNQLMNWSDHPWTTAIFRLSALYVLASPHKMSIMKISRLAVCVLRSHRGFHGHRSVTGKVRMEHRYLASKQPILVIIIFTIRKTLFGSFDFSLNYEQKKQTLSNVSKISKCSIKRRSWDVASAEYSWSILNPDINQITYFCLLTSYYCSCQWSQRLYKSEKQSV